MSISFSRFRETIASIFNDIKKMSNLGYVVLVCLLILANVASYFYILRFDITEGKIYTLSQATRTTLPDLKENVVIKTFFVEEPPDHLITVPREVHEFLDEYAEISHGKLTVETLHPDNVEEDAAEAERVGLPEQPLGQLTNERIELAQGYFGLAIYYGEGSSNYSTIPFVESTRTLEYELTRRIRKLDTEESISVGFLSGHGEYSPADQFRFIAGELSEDYSITNVDISTGNPIEVDALVVSTPTSEFTDRELFEIDQYIMNGGRVLWIVDGVSIDQNSLTTNIPRHNVNTLLSRYGVRINADLVLDERSKAFEVPPEYNLPPQYYPFLVEAIAENMDQEHPITRGLEKNVFIWVSSLEILEEQEGREVTELIKSSELSWTGGVGTSVNLPRNGGYGEGDGNKRLLAAAITGSLQSYFADKEYPSIDNDPRENDNIATSTDQTKMVVVGDQDFIIQPEDRGDIFFLNIINWLVEDNEDFLELRNKTRSLNDRSLREVTTNERNFYKFGNVLAVPVLLVILGIGNSIYRARRRPYI